jgi:hypothetical protein
MAAACAPLRPLGLAPGANPLPGDLDGEEFWFEVSRAFTVDRSLVNLNNGGVSPSPGCRPSP